MSEGNKLQDKTEAKVNKKELCVKEVLSNSNLNLQIVDEEIFNGGGIQGLNEKFKAITNEKVLAACILVLPKAKSVSVIFKNDGGAIVSDSHAHIPHGALVIFIPASQNQHLTSCLNWIAVNYYNQSLFDTGNQTEITRLKII